MEYDAVASELSTKGWAVIEGFLSREETRRLASEARLAAQEFEPAQIGRGAERGLHPEIRSDLILWTDPNGELRDKLDELKLALNRTLFLGLKDFEGHLAVYPAGGGYQKHLDNFRNASPRAVSLVVYLNESWTEPDRGELRIYDNDDHVAAEVAPKGGTLALFLSREVEHEVLPTTRERVSFTGWFRDR